MTNTYFPSKFKSNNFGDLSRLGVIGGMGIVASSKFHYDICQLSSIISPEQDQVQTILLSYPNIPDRTESITRGDENKIVEILNNTITGLNHLEVSHIIICCFTFHIFLNKIDETIRRKIVSLIDYSHSLLVGKTTHTLILCTTGSASSGIFGDSEFLIYPKPEDQQLIHNCIMMLKGGFDKEIVFIDLKLVIARYEFTNLFIGCTDLYILSDYFNNEYTHPMIINPLEILKYDIVNNWIEIKNNS